MAKKSVDPLKAKQKKQKILAGVLGVVFVGLLAFQGPRVLKQLHPSPPPQQSSATDTPPAGTPSLAAPPLQGAEQSPAGTTDPASSLTASSAPPVQDGQLASFSRFASKDPFSQQLSENGGGSSTTGSSSSSDSSGGAGAATSGGKEPAPGSAVISVNGTLYSVPTGTDFPQASTTDPTVVPLFHLISLTAHTATISIVGGSYSSGARTVTLKEKKSVTLMNTADGTRYKLTLMPLGTEIPVPGSGSGTSTTPATVTLPPPTP